MEEVKVTFSCRKAFPKIMWKVGTKIQTRLAACNKTLCGDSEILLNPYCFES